MSTASTLDNTQDLVFELDLDELRVVQEIAPVTALPPRLRVPGFQPDNDGRHRRRSATARLLAHEVLTPVGDQDADGTVRVEASPSLRTALDLGAGAPFAVHSQSWVPAHGSHAVFAPLRLAFSEVRLDVLHRADPTMADAGRAVIAVRPISRLVARIETLLDGAPDALDRGLESVTLGLVDFQALVDAVRSGDPRTVAAVADQLHAGPALAFARALAGRLLSGLRVRVVLPDGTPTHHTDWTQTVDGSWVASMARFQRPADGPTTADDVVSTGQLTVTGTSRTLMSAELLSVVTTLMGTNDD